MSNEIVQLPFDVPLLPIQQLRAGKLRCAYEKGHLRYICFAGVEVLRMIYPALRDEHWGTIIPVIENEIVEKEANGFFVRYTARYHHGDIAFAGEITMQGAADGIVVEMKGEALNGFKKNRIGLCVLHPVEGCAGREVLIARPDGSSYAGTFPILISPHQPFKEIHQMEWATDPGYRIRLVFDGDVFETEDQRNWTDHSYKTYSTPLDRPFPVLLEEGAKISQKVVVKIDADNERQSSGQRFSTPRMAGKRRVPALAYRFDAGSGELFENAGNWPFQHWHLRLDLASADWKSELMRAAGHAQSLDVALELTILFSGSFEEDCQVLVDFLAELPLQIKTIIPLLKGQATTDKILLEHVYGAIKQASPQTLVGYGSDRHFTELNRNRPDETQHDFVAFGFHPQAHASDTRTIIENLQSLGHLLESATAISQKPVVISQIMFFPPAQTNDERLHTSFGASWFLLCLKNMGSASRLTFSGLSLGAQFQKLQSPLLGVLSQLARFRPVYIHYDEARDTVRLENAAGEMLTYVISPEFNDANACH